jgi:crossover junction endodeoxyribonuclease RuvC
MTSLVLGIDPGLSGALALLGPNGLTVLDMPTHALTRGGKMKRDLDLIELSRLIDAAGPIAHAFVEQVGAMPGQGVSSVFAFGKVYGAALGILAAHFIPLTLVSPVKAHTSERDGVLS